MKKTVLLLLAISVFTASRVFADDTIVFKNGDVLTGTILSRDDTSVRFSSTSLGTLELNASDIKEILSPRPAPPEATLPAASAVEDAPAGTQTAAAEAAGLKDADDKTKRQWSGQAGLAIAMRETTDENVSGATKEDKFQTYRLYGHVNWQGVRNSLNWNWAYRYSEDETRKRDDFLNLTQRYNRDFKWRYYGEAKTVFQRDYKRNIDNEFLQTAEVGRRWFDRDRIQFSTSVGGGYHQYERFLASETVYVSEPTFVFDEALEVRLIHSLTLFQTYTHLGDFDRYHFLFSAGLENTLIRDLFIRLEYRFDRDTDTIYDDRDYTDKALLTSLLYKF